MRDLCLTDVLVRRGVLGPAEVVTLVVPLALDLAAMHAAGECHGAVSSDAVGFAADGRPVLRTGTPSSAFVVSPEVARGAPASAAADVFAVAAIGYWALAGRSPWQADDADAAWVRAAAGARPALADVAPRAPARLVEALEAGLAADPRDRCDAHELAERVLASGPAAPLRLPENQAHRRLTRQEPGETTSSRWRLAVLAVLVVLLGGVVARTTSAPRRTAWPDVLAQLNAAREAAVMRGQPARLLDTYAAGSPSLARDRALIRELAKRGLTLRGRLGELSEPRPLTATANSAVLSVLERPAAYALVDRHGRVVVQVRGEARRLVVHLRRVGGTWRISGLG